jgi:hypothetical protein
MARAVRGCVRNQREPLSLGGGMGYVISVSPRFRRLCICLGHQWKQVVERMRSSCRWGAAQWTRWASSSSSMLAKCRLTSTSLVSGQRCSAGCSSSECADRKNRCRGADAPDREPAATGWYASRLGPAQARSVLRDWRRPREQRRQAPPRRVGWRHSSPGGRACDRTGGLDDADQVAPAEAMAHDGHGSLSDRRPGPA